MKLPARIALAACLSVAGFWIAKFGGWVGSLTTVRTPFYFTLNSIVAWGVAVLVFVSVLVNTDKR